MQLIQFERTVKPHVRLAGAFVLVALFAAWPIAQQPVFRSGIDLVTVDVSVLGADGKPVESLDAGRFTVSVDGAPRRVASVEYVPYRRSTARVESTHTAQISSNEHVDPGRLILIAIDQAHIRRLEGREALQAAASFIDALDPGDRVAAAPINHGGTIQFTDDHAGVKRYVQRLSGEAFTFRTGFNIGLTEALAISDGSRTRLDEVVLRECGEPLFRVESQQRIASNEGARDPCPVQIEQQARGIAQHARTQASLSVDALQRLISRLGEIDGPKTLVLVSEGLVAEPQLFELTALGAAAQTARVTIYVLQIEAPMFDASESTPSPTLAADLRLQGDGLARLAASARGALFRLVGADPYPFRKILTELSGYYLLAFEATESDRDGRTHRIDVSVRQSNATVRARPAFRATRSFIAPSVSAQLVNLLRTPRIATELPLRIATYRFRGEADNALRLLVAAETDGSARDVTFGFVLVNESGVVVTSATGRSADSAYSFQAGVAPGGYLIRAAAIDATGRRGTVERRFEAPVIAAGSLRAGDLLVGEPGASPSDPLRPLVQRTTANRLMAYLELYAPEGWITGEEKMVAEIAASDASPALVTAPILLARGQDRWIARADLPLAGLKPGPYVLRVTVRIPSASPQTITRGFVIGGK